ncbi:MAG TPA: hypothetical protein VGR35_15945 [Tepidisphaeraceae bacterium]|nr:hypothetical protein [Tepidisphaeraceae bacterium]
MVRRLSIPLVLLVVLSGHSLDSRQGPDSHHRHAADARAATSQVNVLDVIAPKDLQVRSAANVPRAELSWTDNVEGEAGFLIERSDDGGKTFIESARIRANATTFRDGMVRADAAYSYRVRAIGPDWVTKPAAPLDVRTAAFRVFDALLYSGKPRLERMGMEGIYVAYTHELFPGKVAAEEPHEPSVRAVARRAAQRRQILVLDVEHWPLDIRTSTEVEVQSSIEKLRRMVRWARDERPHLAVGIYSMLPLRDYQAPVLYLRAVENQRDPVWASHLPTHKQRFETWQAANDRLRPLAEEVNCVFPSLYTLFNDEDGWRKYAEANLSEARRYGKPVYAFLWPQFHDSNREFHGKHLSSDFWRMQLEVVRKGADGVVVWGGYQHDWNPRADWWEGTRAFLEE